jgi:hypothetical protein
MGLAQGIGSRYVESRQRAIYLWNNTVVLREINEAFPIQWMTKNVTDVFSAFALRAARTTGQEQGEFGIEL